MSAALPGFAIQAIANLWGQQPELAAGLYAAGAVAAAVPHYVPTFEQAKLWCQKSRRPTRPIAEPRPVTEDAPDIVNSIIAQVRQPSVIIVSQSASASRASETIVTVEKHVGIRLLDTFASCDPTHVISNSPVARSEDSTESGLSQAHTESSATRETLPEVDTKVFEAFLVDTLGTSSEHVAPTSSNELHVLPDIISEELTASSSRRSLASTGTYVPVAQNGCLKPEDQSASKFVDASASASDTEVINLTDMVFGTRTNISPHEGLSHDKSIQHSPLSSTKSKEQNWSDAPSNTTFTVSPVNGEKPSRTLFQVITDNLSATSKLHEKTNTPSDESTTLATTSRTVSTELTSKQSLTGTSRGPSSHGDHGPGFTPSAEQLDSKPLHTSPTVAALKRTPRVEPQQASEERCTAHDAEQKPTESSYYTIPISSLDVVLVFVPSILAAICGGLAGDGPVEQDFVVTMAVNFYAFVVAWLPYLDSRWPTLRNSGFVTYRHCLGYFSSYVSCLAVFFHRRQEALAMVLGKQHTDHFIVDRAFYVVPIGIVLVPLFFFISEMISRLRQCAQPQDAAVMSNRKRAMRCVCIALIIGLGIVWFSLYVQDFVLIFATAGLEYLLYSCYGRVLNLTSRVVYSTYRSIEVARPWIAIHTIVAAMVYLAFHPRQLLECLNRTENGELPPFSHRAIVVKYVVLPVAVSVMHKPFVRVLRGLRVVRAWIHDKYKIIVNGRAVVPWGPRTVIDCFRWALATVALGAVEVFGCLLEWLGPVLVAIAMLVTALAFMYILIPLFQTLFKAIWNTIQPWTVLTSETAAPAIELQTATKAPTFQIWLTKRLTHVVSGCFASAWTMTSSARAKLPMKLGFFHSAYIDRTAAYFGVSCRDNWCQSLTWWWLLRATTIILATIFCTTGWIISAREYPQHKIRSCLSFAISFMVTYILGALGVMQCTQDYPIILATVIAILLFQHYRPQPEFGIQVPADGAHPDPPGGLAIYAPVPLGLPLPSSLWQRLMNWFRANAAARAANERAIREARAAAEEEHAHYQAEVDRLREDESSNSAQTDLEYLQKLREMKAEGNKTQLPRDDGKRPTAETFWDITKPFRPMDTEQQHQAALGKETAGRKTPEAMPEAPTEPSSAPLDQAIAASVLADTSQPVPIFTPATSFTSMPPAPPTTATPVITSNPQANTTFLSPSTSLSSLFAAAPTTASTVAQEPAASTTEPSSKVDILNKLPINSVVEETASYDPTSAPVTEPAEPSTSVINPESEQIPSNPSRPSCSGSHLQGVEPLSSYRKPQDEDKLTGELERSGIKDEDNIAGKAPAIGHDHDHGQDDNHSDDEDGFSSNGSECSFGDGTFTQGTSAPTKPVTLANDGIAAAIEKLREEMQQDGEQKNKTTPTRLASGEPPPLDNNGYDSEELRREARQKSETTPLQVAVGGAPPYGVSGDDWEHDDEGDTPMSGAPKFGADIPEQKGYLAQSEKDDVIMGGMDDEGKEPTPVATSAALLGTQQSIADVSTPQSLLPSGSGLSSVSNLSAHPAPAASNPLPRAPFSTVPYRNDITQHDLDTRYALPAIYRRPATRPADPNHADSEEQWRNRLLGGESTLTVMRREREKREREAAARDANGDGNGGDPPAGSGGPFGGSGPSGGNGRGGNGGGGAGGYGSNPPASFDPSSDGGATNPHEPSPPADGWDNAYDNANGDHARPAVSISSTTQVSPDHPSFTYNPFSNANYRGGYGDAPPTQQVDVTSPEELARIEAAKKDKDMQRDARNDLGLPLGGHTQLPDFEDQGNHMSYGAADGHNDLTAGFLGINLNDNHAYDYGQAHGIDQDFETSPDNATGVNQATTTTTGGEVVDVNWTDIRPKTRLVQLWEDGPIVDNPDYPEHRFAGMKSLEETFGQQCQIFREVDMVAYDAFGENHENFKYAQDGVYWFDPEAEGAELRDSSDHEVGEESDDAVNEVEDGTNDHLSERVSALKTGFNSALQVDSNDESDLSDPPSSDDLDKTGANLLIQEMDDKIPVLKNEGRDVIDDSELASEDADLGNKGEETGASFRDNEVATSYPMITDETKKEAENFACTTNRQILDFMGSIDRPDEREGGSFLTPKSWKGRNQDDTTPFTRQALNLAQKKRYSGPVSFDIEEGDVDPRSKPATPTTKPSIELMADFRAALQNMAKSAGAAPVNSLPAQTFPTVATDAPLRSRSQDALSTLPVLKPSPTSPSSHYQLPVLPSPYGSIKASSLPFDPSKARPYVPAGFDPSMLNRLNSKNPFD